MHRRGFLRLCTSIAAASLASPSFFKDLVRGSVEFKPYRKAPLFKEDGTPLTPSEVSPEEQYIFFYPYRATPCLLINLGEKVDPVKLKLSDGTTYLWSGGVGPHRSIVAYSAICPHQLSYPTPEVSAVGYYPEGVPSKLLKRDKVIQCCAHLSVFDPARGGEVLEGPSPSPLTAIVLSYEGGVLYALGTVGRELFEEFFDVFKPDLRKLYRSTRRAKKLVEKCTVVKMEDYVREFIRC